ncbi:MAG: caspase family protein, partial [Anaerolineae bacterium]|nr:caspase family protein [Anaerolineae bacterium]
MQKPDSVRDPQTGTAKFKRNLAVVIGINEYVDEIPPLRTPVSDAEQVAAVLARDQGYEVQVMLIEDVTRQKLVTLFTETLPALELGSEDRLFVYFAGHGTFIQGDDGEPQYYLVPQDARASERDSFLSMRDVRESLLKLECRHLLLVLDCCFAGGFGRMRAFDSPPPKIYRQRYNFYVRSAAWQVIASAAHDETALDTAGGVVFGRRFSGETPTNSPFALALFDALHGQADTNPPTHPGEPSGDGLITVTELLAFVRDRVQVQADDLSHRQTPALWTLLPKHQAGEYFFGNPQRALRLEEAPALTADTNPYRGLNAYEEMQSALFFGRNKQIQQLCALVEHQPFLAVVGASGTGKSSLVKAGLVPVLKAIATSRYMVIPPFRPTDAPLPTLEKLLADTLPEMQVQAVGFAQDQNALEAFVATWHEKNAGRSLVLVIDQFEELVTLCDENERKQFQELVANALRQHSDTLRVIVTCRTDFEPSFATGPLIEYWKDPSAELQYPEKASKTYGARYVVPLMTQDDLRQVILGPALEREVYFESSVLVEALINEVIQTPGGLPLLSFTLSEMYLQYIQSGRQDRTLSQQEYQAVGGAIGSLRNAANKVYAGLADDHYRSMMERVMLRMVALEGGEVARRRVSTAELNYGPQENAIRQHVVNTLTNARLVVNGGEGSTTWTEPAHDALISGWDRLMEWKLRAAPYLSLQRELAPAALRWQAADPKKKRGLLWNNDPRLAQLQDTLWRSNEKASPTKSASSNAVSPLSHTSQGGFLRPIRQVLFPRVNTPRDPQWLNQLEVSFIQASVKQRLLVFWVIIGAVVGVMFFLGVASVIANNQRIIAEQQATISDSRRLAAQSVTTHDHDLALSYLLGIQASRTISDTYEAKSNLFKLRYEQVQRSSFLQGPTGGVSSVAFSPEGSTLASGSDDKTIRLWDIKTRQQTGQLQGHVSEISSVIFSPDGTLLASASCGQFEVEEDSCLSGQILLWNVKTRQQMGELKGHTLEINCLAFSPDGSTLASGSRDRMIIFWDVKTQHQIGELKASTDEVTSIAFSPNGKLLASGSGGFSDQANPVYLWDVKTRQLNGELHGHIGSVSSTTTLLCPETGIICGQIHMTGPICLDWTCFDRAARPQRTQT